MMRFKDGFDHGNPVSMKWDSNTFAGYVTGVFGTGKAMSGGSLIKTLPGNYVTGIQSFHINPGSLSSGIIAEWRDAGTIQVSLNGDGSGAVNFLRTSGNIPIGTTSSFRMIANTVHWISAKVTVDPSAGEASVKINGVSVLSQTGLNTRATSNSYMNQVMINPNGGVIIDDYHFNDTTGSVNNDYISEVSITTLFPTSDGSNTAWSRGGTDSGSNFSQINEFPEDGDTKYIVSNTPSQINSCKFPALTQPGGTITDVALNVICRKDDALARAVEHYVKSPNTTGTVAVSSLFSPGGSYTNQQSIWENDPNTSAPWAIAAVSGPSGAEYGQELLS